MKKRLMLLGIIILCGCQKTAPLTSETDTAESLIRQALEQTVNTQATLVIDVINLEDTHARGLVKVDGEAGGGLFLATKVDQQWVIPFHGNGAVDCDTLAIYEFPTAILPECHIDYRIETTTGETCSQDTDCLLPMDYAIRSICPYQSRCIQQQCTVICPAAFPSPSLK